MDKKEVTEQDLAQAFDVANAVEKPNTETEKTHKKEKKNKAGKKSTALIISIIMVVVGAIMLIIGVVLLVLDLTRGPVVSDGEYLMEATEWILNDGTNCANADEAASSDDSETNSGETNCMPSVYWKFTEVGKGTLTTNNHINDYDFLWAIEGGKLKIETKWLYDLENEFDYEINKSEKTLTLRDGEKELVFVGDFAEAE